MSYMTFEGEGGYGYQPMGGLGRLPRMVDPCAAQGDPRATSNTQQEDEIKSRLAAARDQAEGAIRDLETLLERAQSVSGFESDILQREIVSAQQILEQATYRIGDQEDNLKFLEDAWSRAPQPWFGAPNACAYAGSIYAKAIPGVQATEQLVRQAMQTAQVRSLRQAVGNLVAAKAQAEQQAADQDLRMQQQHEEDLDREERILAQEQADRDERQRIQEDRDSQRQLNLERELAMQEIQGDLERQRIEAQIAADEADREFERIQFEQAYASAAPAPALAPAGEDAPPWLAELMAALFARGGPAMTPMAEPYPLTPPQEAFAYDPMGNPVDMFGQRIPQFPLAPAPVYSAPAYAAPAPAYSAPYAPATQPAVPSYYTPWQDLLTQGPTIAPPPAMPGSPFQLVQFDPPDGNRELFGLGGLGGFVRLSPSMYSKYPELEGARIMSGYTLHKGPGPYYYVKSSSGEVAARGLLSTSSTPLFQGAEAEDGGPGVFSNILDAFQQLVPTVAKGYQTATQQAAAAVTKKSPWRWVLPVAGVAGAIYVASRFMGGRK